MRAVVNDRYGPPDVLRLDEVARPVPSSDEVLIKVHATTVNRSDCGFRGGNPLLLRLFATLFVGSEVVGGVFRPRRRILGSELAGEVVEVGAAVTEFAVGDKVFGTTAARFGAHAEFVCMKESAPLAHKPVNATFEQAAAVCDGAILTMNALRPIHLAKGQRILVYGASGSMGTAAVQLAKFYESDVTAVCNTRNVELVRSLGADHVIDYMKEDFTKNGETYDVIYDAVGKHSFRRCRNSLKPDGAYVPTDGLENLVLGPITARRAGRKVVFNLPPRYTKKDVLMLKELIEAGRYRAVIDRTYPLEQVVEATKYVETGQKVGNVVLSVSGEVGS